jgi:RNA polymerase sigma-70 factor, ECF subfamily
MPNKRKRFTELITPIFDDFNRFIYSIVRNNYDKDDIIQEALAIAYENFDNLKDKEKYKSWVFTIGKREAFRFIKNNRKKVTCENNSLEQIFTDKYDLEDIVEQEETKREIRKLINEMKESYRDVIILRYFAGLSLTEVADVLGIDYNTIRQRHFRGKNYLYKQLKKPLEYSTYKIAERVEQYGQK